MLAERNKTKNPAALFLTGAGEKAFCAGGDVSGLGDGGGEASSQPSTFGFDSQYSLTLTQAELDGACEFSSDDLSSPIISEASIH